MWAWGEERKRQFGSNNSGLDFLDTMDEYREELRAAKADRHEHREEVRAAKADRHEHREELRAAKADRQRLETDYQALEDRTTTLEKSTRPTILHTQLTRTDILLKYNDPDTKFDT
ncbi:hypothetical protein EG327_006859 [Venturia inaequalis]|uniref:Uncharacterized protein n=1 Tax=Venturia inaequalis TaxID=5025 RepID=A0A8H3Z1N3_VENIN|nr:hypothetical protein EG327_006859 [Venturia inaequalis]